MMDTIFKSLSKTTAFAYFPSSRLPYLSSIPIDLAGFKVAHLTALSNGIFIFLTAVLMQSIKFVAEPAIAPPSVSVARFPT